MPKLVTRVFPALLALALVATTGCSKDAPQFADAAAAAEKKLEEKKALGDNAPKQVEGKKLNAFFPRSSREESAPSPPRRTATPRPST